jgi:hypothetical protein
MEVSDVVFITALLDFLMSLLRDEEAAQEFERDPQGVLARNGLDSVSGQDIRDVTPCVTGAMTTTATPRGRTTARATMTTRCARSIT